MSRQDSENGKYGPPLLLKGNEAICEAAIWAGCRFFFGYPITPQNEIPEYMSRRMPEVGGVFLQAESELAAINMVYGAAAAGARVMTTSSSPGISLMMEGLSYIAGAELPCVVVNIMRGGPGLGNIAGAQSDYLQATKGGGHGDYHPICFAPASVQELYDVVAHAFDVADRYRGPVLVLGDGTLGQMMEPVRQRIDEPPPPPPKDWITDGAAGRPPRIINSLYSRPEDLEEVNLRIQERYERVGGEELAWDEYATADAEVLLAAFGTAARVCRTACDRLREAGVRAGLFRPITVAPFPYARLAELAQGVERVVVAELNLGQMVEDVRLAVEGRCPVHFVGRTAGVYLSVGEIVDAVLRAMGREEGAERT